jgi:hypothetical protein
MKLHRKSRLFAALLALFSMLFMQLAVAAYACPTVGATQGEPRAEMRVHADMQGCGGVDTAQPALCHAHVHADKQSLDKPQLPDVQPFIATALLLAIADIGIHALSAEPQPDNRLLVRATAPPHSIQHCCFRI